MRCVRGLVRCDISALTVPLSAPEVSPSGFEIQQQNSGTRNVVIYFKVRLIVSDTVAFHFTPLFYLAPVASMSMCIFQWYVFWWSRILMKYCDLTLLPRKAWNWPAGLWEIPVRPLYQLHSVHVWLPVSWHIGFSCLFGVYFGNRKWQLRIWKLITVER